MKHIVVIGGALPPQRGGMADQIAKLCVELSKRVDKVTVVTLVGNESVSLFPCEVQPILSNWSKEGCKQLHDFLLEARADKVILPWVPHLYDKRGMNLRLPTMFYKLRHSIHLYTAFYEWAEDPKSLRTLLPALTHRVSARILLAASEWISTSVYRWKTMLENFGDKPIRFVPIGSNIPVTPAPAKNLEALRKQCLGNGGTQIVATVVGFGSGRSVGFIVDTWKRIHQSNPNVRLLMLGSADKSQSPELFELPGVHIPGYLEPEEFSAWLQISDIYMAPYWDGLSSRRSAPLVAMAHGLPVVSTRGRLYDREVFDQSPIVCEEYRDQDVSNAILALLKDTQNLTSLGESTREFFKKTFAWNCVVDGFLAE